MMKMHNPRHHRVTFLCANPDRTGMQDRTNRVQAIWRSSDGRARIIPDGGAWTLEVDGRAVGAYRTRNQAATAYRIGADFGKWGRQ